MYQVYCDNLLMYHPSIAALKIKTPKVNLEVNKTGNFDFQIFPTHPYYNDLKRLKSIIKVYQDDKLLFRGRIIDDQSGFYNQKQVTCEGELAFLLDSIQRPYNYTGDVPEYFAQLITSHNSQVDAEHQFKVGNVTVTDPNGYINRSDTTYQNTFTAITTKLIETHGGYLWVRHEADGNYLDYIDDFTTVSNQPVEFGKNLLDITKKTKGADIATAIIPLGAKLEGSEDRVTIVSVNGGVDYVYSPEAVSIYGWIFKVQTWDDVTVPANLLTKANEYLTSAVNISTEIELSAVDLSALNTSVDAFHLGNYVTVHATPHGIDQNFFVNKLTLDLTNPKSNKLTLGMTFSSFTEQTIASEKVTQKLIESVSSGAKQDLSLYNTAVQRLTSLITNSFGVYKTEQEVEGGSVIYYLHDKSTLEASETIWKMTADAFAVSTDGGDTWNAGFDAQGNAVFNVLNAIGINAEWIKVLTNFTVGNLFSVDSTGKLVANSLYSNNANITGGSFVVNSDASGMTVIKIKGPSTQGGNSITYIDQDGVLVNNSTSKSYTFVDGRGVYLYKDIDYETAHIGIQGGAEFSSLLVHGTKNRVVSTKNYGGVLLNAYETPRPTFADTGRAQISNDGFCYIDMDLVFLETIDTVHDYTYFLTKYGQGDLWVRKDLSTKEYFVVEGTPNLEFSWKIEAVQRDYNTYNLEKLEGEGHEIQEVDYADLADEYLSENEKEMISNE